MTQPRALKWVLATALHRPGLTFTAWAVLAFAAAAVAAATLRVDTGTTTFLDRSSPEWLTYQETLERFGGDEYVAISLEGTTPYDWELLSELPGIARRLERIEGVRRVDSLATVALIRPANDGLLRTDAAVGAGVPDTPAERRALRNAIETDLVADRVLISENGRYLGLAVILDKNLDADRVSVVEDIRDVVAPFNATVSGVPVFRTEVNLRTQRETAVFVPATLLLIGGLTYLWLRSASAVLALLTTGGVGSLVTIAGMGLGEVPVSLSTMILPSILLALGCAYTMHILVASQGCALHRLEDRLGDVLPGVVWSGVTTAIGFAAMSTTSVEAIRELAAYGAIGVVVVTAAAISLAPAVLVMIGVVPRDTALLARTRQLAEPLASAVVRYRRPIVLAWILISVGVGLGAFGLRVETNIIEWFRPTDPIRASYDKIRDQFSGITPVSVVVRSENGGPVTDPAVLEAVANLRAAAERLGSVGRVLSVTEALRMTRRAFGESGLPETLAEAEQHLLLLEGEEQLEDVITSDRRATQLLLRLNSNMSSEIVALSDWVDSWWSVHGVEGYEVETTGVMYEFARAQEAIASSQIRGLGIAVVAIGLVLVVSLGSVRQAFIAMIPNALPIALGFGAMGLIGISLDAATVCLGNLALGIAVDDTVHVMFSAQRADGDGDQMVSRALSPILPALSLTTVCIASGFAVLGLSDFVLIRNLGIVTAVVVVLCWVADVTLLPALLVWQERKV